MQVKSIMAAAALFSAPLMAAEAVQPAKETATMPDPGAQPMAAGEGRAVAETLAKSLVASFVYRDQAEDYAAMLRRNAASGRYDSGTRSDVAKRMTDDLQAVKADGHLHVMLAEPDDGSDGAARRGPPRKWPPLIQSAKTIAPGIGYIRFTAFFGTDEEVQAVRDWLAANRDAKTLIFDLRNHHGGGLDEQDVIFEKIFKQRTPLVKMALSKAIYDERGSPLEESERLKYVAEGDKMVATHIAIPGAANPLQDAKVYLLTSNKSASAAEHFALALKSSGRATLIGEATAGANHFGGPEKIGDHFAVWLPVGRTYDIKTGKDWEGDGIAPDIAVDPKDALVVALEKAGVPRAEAVRLDAGEVPAEPIHDDKLKRS